MLSKTDHSSEFGAQTDVGCFTLIITLPGHVLKFLRIGLLGNSNKRGKGVRRKPLEKECDKKELLSLEQRLPCIRPLYTHPLCIGVSFFARNRAGRVEEFLRGPPTRGRVDLIYCHEMVVHTVYNT